MTQVPQAVLCFVWVGWWGGGVVFLFAAPLATRRCRGPAHSRLQTALLAREVRALTPGCVLPDDEAQLGGGDARQNRVARAGGGGGRARHLTLLWGGWTGKGAAACSLGSFWQGGARCVVARWPVLRLGLRTVRREREVFGFFLAAGRRRVCRIRLAVGRPTLARSSPPPQPQGFLGEAPVLKHKRDAI